MSDLYKAAQQALEALERSVKLRDEDYDAMDALKAALAQQKQCADESDCTHMPWCRVRKACQRAAQAQQEQEPVADAETYLRDRYGAARGHHAWRELTEAFNAGCASAQQAEPVREWQWLTDEEIAAALPHEPGDLDFACALAIEAALKEKNHG